MAVVLKCDNDVSIMALTVQYGHVYCHISRLYCHFFTVVYILRWWQVTISQFYRRKKEPVFTAEFIADKIISHFYRSCIIQKWTDFLRSKFICR